MSFVLYLSFLNIFPPLQIWYEHEYEYDRGLLIISSLFSKKGSVAQSVFSTSSPSSFPGDLVRIEASVYHSVQFSGEMVFFFLLSKINTQTDILSEPFHLLF